MADPGWSKIKNGNVNQSVSLVQRRRFRHLAVRASPNGRGTARLLTYVLAGLRTEITDAV
jgi:hypothetical protein